MKKKIINGILLVAMVFATSSAFVSCKDNDADAAVEMNGNYQTLLNRLTALENKVAGIKSCDCNLDAINAKIKALEDAIAALPGSGTTDLSNYVTKDELAAALAGIVTADQLDAYAKAADVDAAIAALQSILETFETQLEAELKGMITSVNVLGVDNPVFGTAALPLDVKTTVLGSFYNELTQDITFPSTTLANKIGIKAEKEYAGETIASASAGKIYVTLNPTNGDFSGITAELANSQNVAAPVTLSPLAPSDKVINFGYTRANMNLYETEVTITDYAAAALNIDMEQLKADAKNVLNNKKSLTAYAAFAADALNQASGICDANYLTIATDGKILGKREISSETAFAVAAVKPLSYKFLAGKSFSLPIERIESAISKLINKINITFDVDFSKFDKEFTVTNDKQVIITVTIDEPITVTGTTNVKGQDVEVTVKGKDSMGGDVTLTGKGTVKDTKVDFEAGTTLTITKDIDITDDINDIYESLNGELEDFNDMLKEVQKLADFNTTIENAKNDVKKEIFSYLERFNNKFEKLTSKLNVLLQPALIAVNKSEVRRVPASETNPYKASGVVKLVPTTFTSEILAPAYKKIIAVTAINGSTAGIKDFNSKYGLAQVVNGDAEYSVEFEAGKTYEITYASVDYFGNYIENRYFIQGK